MKITEDNSALACSCVPVHVQELRKHRNLSGLYVYGPLTTCHTDAPADRHVPVPADEPRAMLTCEYDGAYNIRMEQYLSACHSYSHTQAHERVPERVTLKRATWP